MQRCSPFAQTLTNAVISARRGRVDWNPTPGFEARANGAFVGWTASTSSVSSLLIDTPCSAVDSRITAELGGPVIDVFFQEKMFWEFTLTYEGLMRIRFSVAPNEWEAFDPEWHVGTPEDLAELWSVPVAQIERYMVDWQATEVWNAELGMATRRYLLKGQKAYPDDEYGYGEVYQGLDFIRALGGENPQKGSKFWAFLPPLKCG